MSASEKDVLTKLIIDATCGNRPPSDIAADLIAHGVTIPPVKCGDLVYFEDGTPATVEAVGHDGEEGWFRVSFHKGEYACEAFMNNDDIGKTVFMLSDMEKKARAKK